MDVSVSETTSPGIDLQIAYRPLRELIPYARNARTHSADQIKLIRQLLGHYGWTNPMLIAGNDMIAGHARLTAAMQMASAGQMIPRNADPWRGPTIDLSHLSEDDRRAYIIADNQSALLAGWDQDLLRIDMGELRERGFDLSLTGFASLEVDVMLGGTTDGTGKQDGIDRALFPDEQTVWNAAWRSLMEEWHARFEATRLNAAPLSSTFSPASLAVYFVRAMLYGGEIPRGCTLAYQPHRMWVNAHQLPLSELFLAATQNPSLMDSVRWQCQNRPLYDKLISASLGIHGHRAPNDFPAHLARDLINEFCPDHGARILDPCHGWGGRLLGFMLSRHGAHYHGYDVCDRTQDGVRRIFADLLPYCLNQQRAVQLDLIPYQEAQPEADTYDFALTSPPYYNVEKYDGDRQSWRDFASFDDWVAGFYRPLLGNTARALKPGKTFALQVGSQNFPLARLAKEIAPRVGMHIVAIRPTDMTNIQTQTAAHDGEVIVIMRKADGSEPISLYVTPPVPPGYLAELFGVTIRRIETVEEAKGAIRIRQPWAGKMLRPLPPIVYYGAMEDGRLWGAFDDTTGAIIGYAMARVRKREASIDLQQIAVNDNAPKGVARRLMSVIWEWAVDRGAKKLTVNTLLTSERARMLYDRFGFSETNRDHKDIDYAISLDPVQHN